jgi:hypothetical protein
MKTLAPVLAAAVALTAMAATPAPAQSGDPLMRAFYQWLDDIARPGKGSAGRYDDDDDDGYRGSRGGRGGRDDDDDDDDGGRRNDDDD